MKRMIKIRNLCLAIIATTCVFVACDDDDEGMENPMPEIDTGLYISSNTSGMITSITIDENMAMNRGSIAVQAQDADGIYYDEPNDVIYQVNRQSNVVNAYSNAMGLMDGDNASPSATSESDHFNNGREIAFSNGQIVVANDDTDDVNPLTTDQFVIFSATPSQIQYQKTLNTPTNLWGIQLVGNDLWAIEDNSSNVVVFRNIFSYDDGDVVTPDKSVSAEGIVRTHGLFYDSASDTMILTDVGDGGNDSDGAFSVITGFQSKFNDQDMISAADQTRVSGSNTFLGNPVDVSYDNDNNMVYIAERANAGGRVLAFEVPSSDANASPLFNEMVEGASAIYMEE